MRKLAKVAAYLGVISISLAAAAGCAGTPTPKVESCTPEPAVAAVETPAAPADYYSMSAGDSLGKAIFTEGRTIDPTRLAQARAKRVEAFRLARAQDENKLASIDKD